MGDYVRGMNRHTKNLKKIGSQGRTGIIGVKYNVHSILYIFLSEFLALSG